MMQVVETMGVIEVVTGGSLSLSFGEHEPSLHFGGVSHNVEIREVLLELFHSHGEGPFVIVLEDHRVSPFFV